MPGGILTYVYLGFQIYCIVHVVRNQKRWWWILIILFIPFGCLWYSLREMGSSGGRYGQVGRVRMVNRNPAPPAASARMIRDLEAELEYSDTVDTRARIAEVCYDIGEYGKAVFYYRSCLKGVYADDAPLLYELARALMADEQPADCIEVLERLKGLGRTDYANERILLEAKARQAEGQTDRALQLYDSVYNRLSGEEARCRYALLLQEVGNTDKAQELFVQILDNARRGDSLFKSRNKDWIEIARRSRG